MDVIPFCSYTTPFIHVFNWLCQNRDKIIYLPDPLNYGYQKAVAQVIANHGQTVVYFADGREPRDLVILGPQPMTPEIRAKVEALHEIYKNRRRWDGN